MNSAKQIKETVLKTTLEVLLDRYNAVPSQANYNRLKAVRAEIADLG